MPTAIGWAMAATIRCDIDADEPLLFHTGPRRTCGAMTDFLAAAPRAEVAPGAFGCLVSLDDQCDRPPRKLADGEVIDLGGKRVRHIDTPHVLHNWEARVLFDETTGTLFCGDLFTHPGDLPAITDTDIVGPALAALEPHALALMHGSSTRTRCRESRVQLANAYDRLTGRL